MTEPTQNQESKNTSILDKLATIEELPSIPSVLGEALSAIDNPDTSAAHLARIVERDQSLTARILKVANSPFYGFSRKISTIDLAVVVMGMKTIKEIILTLLIKRLFSNVASDVLDVRAFWSYSVYCGAASRLLAKKLGYKVTGEAFVAGLMHDIGILIEAEYFTDLFEKFRHKQNYHDTSFVQLEKVVFGADHTEVGAWLSEKWNLPTNLTMAIRYHHTHYTNFIENDKIHDNVNFNEIDQPLTAIVSLAEWFAELSGRKNWALESSQSSLYLSKEVLDNISEHDILEQNSAFEMLSLEIESEFEKASTISSFIT